MSGGLQALVRGLLDRAGYVLWKRDYLRYGVLPFNDIARLSRHFDWPIRTFFDVGANIGQTSREALVAFPEARIFAFEPHADSYARLASGISDRRFSAHNVALGNSNAVVPLYEYGKEGDGSLINSLVPNARFPTHFGYKPVERSATCVTLDRFCEESGLGSIDVLKLDTEGADLFVLEGAGRMLAEERIRFIYTEFNDLKPRAGVTGGSLMPIADFIAPFGFRFVATYTDYITPGKDIFVCSNALFCSTTRSGESSTLAGRSVA